MPHKKTQAKSLRFFMSYGEGQNFISSSCSLKNLNSIK